MTPDDPFYSPTYRPVPRKPRAAEPLWELRRDGVTWTCELRYHAERGVEATSFRNGEFLMGRRFDTRVLAVQWADFEAAAINRKERDGPHDESSAPHRQGDLSGPLWALGDGQGRHRSRRASARETVSARYAPTRLARMAGPYAG